MLNLLLLPLEAEHGAGIAPFVIGIGTLLLLLGVLFAILAFGKGREHS